MEHNKVWKLEYGFERFDKRLFGSLYLPRYCKNVVCKEYIINKGRMR